MPRKTLKRWMPNPQKIREMRDLRFLGSLLHDPNLFHLTRHSVSVAFFFGLFIAFLPIPFQVVLAALVAFVVRCNLPITLALVFTTNPLTAPIILIACYKFGANLLNIPARNFEFELSFQWFLSEFLLIWQPLLLGCFLASCFFGCLGYLTIQWVWRWNIVTKWEKRKLRRQQKRNSDA